MKYHRWILQVNLPCTVMQNEDEDMFISLSVKSPTATIMDFPSDIFCCDCNERVETGFGEPCEGVPERDVPDTFWGGE